jgi:hypothetical protein
MMVRMSVDEHAPGAPGQRTEGRVLGPHPIDRLAAEAFEQRAQLAHLGGKGQRRASDQLRRRRRSFRKGQPIDDQLLERRIANRQPLPSARQFAERHALRIDEVSDHLNGRHRSPSPGRIRPQVQQPRLKLAPILSVPHGLHWFLFQPGPKAYSRKPKADYEESERTETTGSHGATK